MAESVQNCFWLKNIKLVAEKLQNKQKNESVYFLKFGPIQRYENKSKVHFRSVGEIGDKEQLGVKKLSTDYQPFHFKKTIVR